MTITMLKPKQDNTIRVFYRGVWVPTYLLPHRVVVKLGRAKLYSSQLPIKPKRTK